MGKKIIYSKSLYYMAYALHYFAMHVVMIDFFELW